MSFFASSEAMTSTTPETPVAGPSTPPEWAAELAAARAGDTAAYGALVERFWVPLVRVARGVLGSCDAEDVVQDALVVAWRRLDDVRGAASLPAWLRQIVVRRALRRARWRLRWVPLPLEDTVATGGGDEQRHRQLDLMAAIARLSARQRAVLVLTEIEGLSDASAAETLGIAEATLRVHRFRAKAELRRFLKVDLEKGGDR